MSRAYLRHLHLAGEMTAATLMTIHNLAFYLDTLRQDAAEYPFGSIRGVPARDAPALAVEAEAEAGSTARPGRRPEKTPDRHGDTEVLERVMTDARSALLLALAARPGRREPSAFASLILMGLIFAIFYFVLILPMRSKQRKLERARARP